MTVRTWIAFGTLALAAVVLAQNLFGEQINAFLLSMPGIDKVLHAAGYLLVFICVYRVAGRVTTSQARRSLLAAGTGLVLSAADEISQHFAPGRSVEIFDVVAGCAGLTAGWVLATRPRRIVGAAALGLAGAAAGFVTYDTHVRLIDYSRALAYERQHDFSRAREYYLRALAAGHRTPEVYNGLAWASVESGVADPAEAVRYAGMALAAQPDNADVLDTYGWALHAAGRSGDALPHLLKAYELKPDMYCIHYHLGAAYLTEGDVWQAEHHLRRQLEREGTREAVLAADALAQLAAKDVTQPVATRGERR